VRLRGVALCLLIGAIPAAGLCQSDDPGAPPAGIVPAELSLAQVLARHERAQPVAAAPVYSQTWAYSRAGLTGSETDVVSQQDERVDVQLGPFHSAHGIFRGVRWIQNENGAVRNVSGIHRMDEADDAALAHASEEASGVQLLGRVADPAAYVVRVNPRGGRLEYLYYDVSSYRLVKADRVVESRRVTTVYDDFRTVGSRVLPGHIHETNGLSGDDQDWTLQNAGTSGVSSAALTPPAAAAPFELGARRTTLPASFSADRVILAAKLASHTINFQLDSGASTILLDRGIADATGAQSFGKSTQVTAGEYNVSDTLTGSIGLGDALIRHAVVETAPFHMRTYGGDPVAGLLGYDFFASFVVHLDYQHAAAEAFAPDAFTAPAGAIELPARLDDGVPVIEVRIGTARARNFIVDTGADRSMIFSAFANAHPLDVPNAQAGEASEDFLPTADQVGGVGGMVQVYPATVSGFSVGSLNFARWQFDVSQNAPGFESEDYDGLLGQDFLRYFDVYFDYPHSRIYLLPNDRYRDRFA